MLNEKLSIESVKDFYGGEVAAAARIYQRAGGHFDGHKHGLYIIISWLTALTYLLQSNIP